MIELLNNALVFRFPEVHPEARCSIDFQRTLRIPDDNREYALPPGLGRFPAEHVDDHAGEVPADWRRHGGIFIPMYQSEALWINFSGEYPCAVKIAAGKINAVTGKAWTNALSDDPQDYVVIPEQPWLDGFNVSKDHIRQFVAMPLGDGYTVEEQLTGKAEHGGIQIIAYPMKHDVYVKRFENIPAELCRGDMLFAELSCSPMGLAPGGLMRQKIYDDIYGLDAWDQDNGFRCYVHLANSAVYRSITGRNPPQEPPSARDYTEAGMPWFDYYSDAPVLEGSDVLAGTTSVGAMAITKTGKPVSGNDPVQPKTIRVLGRGHSVRDGMF